MAHPTAYTATTSAEVLVPDTNHTWCTSSRCQSVTKPCKLHMHPAQASITRNNCCADVNHPQSLLCRHQSPAITCNPCSYADINHLRLRAIHAAMQTSITCDYVQSMQLCRHQSPAITCNPCSSADINHLQLRAIHAALQTSITCDYVQSMQLCRHQSMGHELTSKHRHTPAIGCRLVLHPTAYISSRASRRTPANTHTTGILTQHMCWQSVGH
jgi:hypothetical protein